ncbi:MAG: YbhB/YbcL family Raf kinase inhibitor-like protein [Candidatus Taylorbacteria bacterium]|nr:YbhB/YbcL family Raf kinase inhibitor-like protein [Candidatus Taylorbacteria bacterium]
MKTAQLFRLSSPAFQNGDYIPQTYACDGRNICPELDMGGLPEGTRSLALVLEDPDAPKGTFYHWVVWNIPAETKMIPEACSPFGISGLNSADDVGYVGPCPPTGVHHYVFRLFALNSMLDIPSDSRGEDLLKVIGRHTLEEARLVGLYERSN